LFFAATGIGLLLWGVWSYSNSRQHQLFGEIITSVSVADSIIALTLDDGPTPEFTGDVLNVLSQYEVKATFFLTGREAETNPEQARQIKGEGHELGNHSYHHEIMMLRSQRYVGEEISRTDAALRAAGQEGDLHFRPPYGKKLFALPWYLSRQNRKTIMWDIEPESFPEIAREPGLIRDHILERARPGSIILMHVMYSSRAVSRAALPMIIEGLQSRGDRFVTVNELLAAGQL
jgi:peptidoglycan/xylan/chitin deacetylase (PgdA/CDA1 family)